MQPMTGLNHKCKLNNLIINSPSSRSQRHSAKQWLWAIMVTNDNSQSNCTLDEHIQNKVNFPKRIPKPLTMGEICAIWMTKN